jgi:hypothetical protein
VLAPRPLHAAPVTLQFFGSFSFVGDHIDHAISVGSPFEFSLTYDTDAPFHAFVGNVYHTGSASWSFAGYSDGNPSGVSLWPSTQGLMSSLVSDTRAHFELDRGTSTPIGSVLPGNWGLRAISFFYFDAATPAGELPVDANPGASMEFSLYYSQLDANGNLVGAPLGATGVATGIHSVPEPSSALLFVTGGLVLTGWRTARGRRRPAPHR